MIFNGRILDILEAKEGLTKTKGEPYKVVEFVVEELVQERPNKGCFSLFSMTHETYGNKVDKFKKECSIGSEVEIDYKIEANEWNGKYYTKLSVWKVDAMNLSGAYTDSANKSRVEIPAEDETSDLPF